MKLSFYEIPSRLHIDSRNCKSYIMLSIGKRDVFRWGDQIREHFETDDAKTGCNC
jgi:hypothetical protein